MDESEVMQVDNMECDLCDERVFQEREGYYYCVECGTKKEQLRAVEISAEDTFNDTTKHLSQRVIKKPKVQVEENDITSWEFYNYVLRGFLEELLNMGAKPELKLMTLQIWAAYMSRLEVAFCKNDDMSLPKLNVRALARDARIIYNHKQNKRKRERLNKKQSNQPGDERANWREWRKTKRKLDETGCSDKSVPPSESTLHNSQSLALQWSRNARKSLKKKMSLKHLDKHSVDSTNSMHCHGLRPKAGALNYFDRNIYCLNITKLYVVLAMALNLVEDNIQLTDLLRFIDEEYLTKRYILSYLPENVARNGKTLLKQMEMSQQKDKCRYKFMRIHIAQMSRFIDINGFQTPNLHSLARRYVLELSLPSEVADYVISLMYMLPPSFDPSYAGHTYPRYELRVMAYIIYALKLLFGLDDAKERAISESAEIINEQLKQLSEAQPQSEATPIPQLFVYTEWMQFVELRKVLISHYNESFALRFGITTQSDRKIHDYIDKERKQKSHEYNHNEMVITPAMQRMHENIKLIFEKFLKDHYGESTEACFTSEHIEFDCSLTPARSYFKRILSSIKKEKVDFNTNLPESMFVDHTLRKLAPFKNEITELSNYLNARAKHLHVEELACQMDYKSVGFFQVLQNPNQGHQERRANTDITLKNWMENLHKKEKRPDFVFRQPVATYGRQYQNKRIERSARRQALEINNPFLDMEAPSTFVLKINDEAVPLDKLSSIQVFEECNMDPLRVPLTIPRVPASTVFEEDDDIIIHKKENQSQEQEQEYDQFLLNISNFDCWLLHGYIAHTREYDRQKLRSLFPCSFRWLLETCAATIGVEWCLLYEQLMVLEVMFHHGVDWSNHKSHLSLKYHINNKDINLLIKHYRDMW